MNNEYKKVCPFKFWVLQNFPFIDEDFDSLTNYELMCKLSAKINEIIKSVNDIGESEEQLYNAFDSLKSYVDNYFDNLDVQDEINNKLDDMASKGELEEIIAQYLEVASLLCYNTKADLKGAENLIDGSFAKTFGNLTYNDGLGNLYKIRELINTDVVDDDNLVALTNYPTLVAEKIPNTHLINVDNKIGNLSNLTTNSKTNIVSALNEIVNHLKEGSNDYPAGTTFHILAGSIRQDDSDPTVWDWIEDSNHEKIGFDDEITIDSSNYYVKVNFDQEYDKVVTFIATPDNYLASNAEVSIGASVGLDNALISMGTSHRIDGMVYYDPTNEEWVDSLGGSVTFSNGIITLTPNSNLITYPPVGFDVKPVYRGFAPMKTLAKLETGYRASFFNPDGTLATTASNDMAFLYEIGGNSRSVRMNTPMGASSNIWLFGIMAKYPDV